MAPAVTHIALTGGPCGGKSTALPVLRAQAADAGYRVLMVPEAATVLGEMGMVPGEWAGAGAGIPFEGAVLDLQLAYFQALSTAALDPAAPPGPGGTEDSWVVLHDRGPLDGRAYIDDEAFCALLAARGWALDDLFHQFSGAIHLTSAAKGARHAYGVESNPHRSETPEAAAALDDATLAAWSGATNHWIIGNEGDFAAKLVRAGRALSAILGSGVESEHKYLLDPVHVAGLPAGRWRSIEQWYLPTAEGERRIRATLSAGVTSYSETTKSGDSGLTRREVERPITSAEFSALRDRSYRLGAPARVGKDRWTGAWGSHRYEIDHITYPVDLWLMEVEVLDAADPVELPPFVSVVREVTDDPGFRNSAIARCS